MGKHPAFHQGPRASHNYLVTEFEAAAAFGLDPDAYFAKPRQLRSLMAAYVIGSNAVKAMRDFDLAKERESKRDG